MSVVTFENEKDEIIQKLLGVDIRVQTNKGNEWTLRYSNFKGEKDSNIEQSVDDCRKPRRQIIVTINCDNYTFEVV